jgi:hypothetical protein
VIFALFTDAVHAAFEEAVRACENPRRERNS